MPVEESFYSLFYHYHPAIETVVYSCWSAKCLNVAQMCSRFLKATGHYSRGYQNLSFQLQPHRRQEPESDGLAGSQRPCVEAAEVQKSRCDPKVESRQVSHEDIVLVQDFDKNLVLVLQVSLG